MLDETGYFLLFCFDFDLQSRATNIQQPLTQKQTNVLNYPKH